MKIVFSAKTFFAIFFICTLLLLIPFANQTSAQSSSESGDRWVLRETTQKTDLCEIGPHCVNPQINIEQSGAFITWGVGLGDCEASYQAVGKWTTPPETLIPGQSESTLLESSLSQTTACDAALDADNFVSLMIGKVIPPDTAGVGKWELIGGAQVKELLQKGKEFNDGKTVNWSVPQGNTGEELHLRLGAGTGSLPGGYIVFIYEYLSGNTKAKTDKPIVETQPEQDVCGIGIKKTGRHFDSFFPPILARDSGARFSDFSGEVTVAPGSDPEDTQPAEMDMVLETGSIIQTESESYAIISFADMTTFCMKPFTKVILDTPPEKESKLSLLAGKVWINVKKMIQDGTMNVTMNQAVAGIKGTILVLEDYGNTSSLKVIDGNVELRDKEGKQTESVNSGETLTADSQGLGEKTTFDINTERQNWKEFVNMGGRSDKNTNRLWLLIGAGTIISAITIIKLMRKRKAGSPFH